MSQPIILNLKTVLQMLPTRTPESHKGSYGKVLAVCGSSPYRGAAVLSVMGALRTGAGLVTLAAPECVAAAAAARVPEGNFSARCRTRAHFRGSIPLGSLSFRVRPFGGRRHGSAG